MSLKFTSNMVNGDATLPEGKLYEYQELRHLQGDVFMA